ncbi:MAG: SPASM domain-containing protein [Magnetococcales bacterium]|nr:SPASM domain-containing protein [Magnetococcales bacterium]
MISPWLWLWFHAGFAAEMVAGPRLLNIELTARCQLRCAFCPTQTDPLYKARNHSGDMPLALVRKILGELSYPVEISFHKDGEPLLYPYLADALRESSRFFTHFCTNGLLLARRAERILGWVDLVTLSVVEESPEQVAAVRAFLDRLGSWAGSGGGKKTRLNIKTFSPAMEAYWRTIHPDVFLTPEHNWGDWKKPWGGASAEEERLRQCPQLVDKMAVNYDGSVSACCLDFRHQALIGDVRHQTIAEIWNGEPLAKLRGLIAEGRSRETAICGQCQFLLRPPDAQGQITGKSG